MRCLSACSSTSRRGWQVFRWLIDFALAAMSARGTSFSSTFRPSTDPRWSACLRHEPSSGASRCSPSYLLPQMLAQSADAQALEKTVIEGFNTKLAARAQSLAAANEGVRNTKH